MNKLTYKGYTISQASNNHITISKDNKYFFHAQLNRKLSNEEMKKQIDWFIEMQSLLFDKELEDE